MSLQTSLKLLESIASGVHGKVLNSINFINVERASVAGQPKPSKSYKLDKPYQLYEIIQLIELIAFGVQRKSYEA